MTIMQLSLWDQPTVTQIPQVYLAKQNDGGYDVVHRLSGRLVCSFRPTFVRRKDAQAFCDMLVVVDLDTWWTNGCPDDGTPQKVGKIQIQWREKTFPGLFDYPMRRIP